MQSIDLVCGSELNPKKVKTLKIGYPNDFDIESVRISIIDHSTNKTEFFILPISSGIGKHIKDFFDPMPIEMRVKMAGRYE